MRLGLTLLEVLIALSILAMVAAFLMALRVDALRNERAQREHTTLTQLVRSEGEILRAGGGGAGTCSSLVAELATAGFSCEVEAACTFPSSICGAAPDLVGYVVRATTPQGAEAELPLLFRRDPRRKVEAQR